MAESEQRQDEPVQIDARREADRWVVLTPDDEDRFVKDCRSVVEATKQQRSRELWLRELHGLLSHVRDWATKHASSVKLCYATPRDDQMAIFVVPKSGSFDFDLEDQLTELDIALAEKFQEVPCDVLQMPEKSRYELDELTDNHLAILIYDESGQTQGQVAP